MASTKKKYIWIPLVVVAIIATGFLVAFAVQDREPEDRVSNTDDTTTTEVTTTSTTAAPPVNVTVDNAALATLFDGDVDPTTELVFGDAAVELLENAPEERGDAAHSANTLKTPADVIEWFNSGDPKAVPVRDRVALSVIAQCGEADAARIMDGEGWITMVVLPESQVLNTSYSDGNGGMEFANGWRQTGEKDGYHIPVCLTGPNAGKIVANGMVRADCGNGHDSPKIRIYRPGMDTAVPVDVPPSEVPKYRCPDGREPTPEGLCPKDPSKDINNNTEVPEQVRKDGPSPDNRERIERGPTVPHDTPSGCAGRCPTTTTTPPSGGNGGGTSTTVPSSNGGNTGVTAPPTSAPPPAPPTTESPTVTVVSP